MADNVNTTYTIEQFIEIGSSDLMKYENLTLYDKSSEGNVIPSYNILNDYIDELKELCQNTLMSNEEFARFKYKPKLLSYEVYGSQELYFIILMLNGIPSIKEFNKPRLKMLSPKILNDVLSYIYNSQKNIINKNRNKMGI